MNIEERYRVSERHMLPLEYDEVGEDGIRRQGFHIPKPPEVLFVERIIASKVGHSDWGRYAYYVAVALVLGAVVVVLAW